MYACPECYQPVRVRPGAPEGRCTPCLHAARLSTALRRAKRLGLAEPDGLENRKTGATPSGAKADRKNSKGGRYGKEAGRQR